MTYRPLAVPGEPGDGPPPVSRVAFAAAHVVPDPLAAVDPWHGVELDWEATLGIRRRLWRHGLGVAEAMDTAQRGSGLDWPTATRLITATAAEARAVGGRVCAGAGTDQLGRSPSVTIAQVAAAYAEQCEAVERAGAQVVLMASRALAACARGPDDYLEVYGRLIGQVGRPVILHWLGPAFDPALSGYWGHDDPDEAGEVVTELARAHPGRVDGVKVSLLDPDLERRLGRALPAGVRLYTGDDHHYLELVADGSDALLGILDGISAPAARGLRALDAGDIAGYQAALEPTVPLARHVFATPTRLYKTGLAFLSWLQGDVDHPRMVAGMEAARSVVHLARIYQLADRAGVLPDPDLALRRIRRFLSVSGVPT
ncbi:MAG: DUF993 family protein [Kineosporiaceae bacterium]